MGQDGFEPPKTKSADLQSAPFGHSGTDPKIEKKLKRAEEGTRTPDRLITNQELYQLSYFGLCFFIFKCFKELDTAQKNSFQQYPLKKGLQIYKRFTY